MLEPVTATLRMEDSEPPKKRSASDTQASEEDAEQQQRQQQKLKQIPMWSCFGCQTKNEESLGSVCKKCAQSRHAPPVATVASRPTNEGILSLPSMDSMVNAFQLNVAAYAEDSSSVEASGMAEWACVSCQFVNDGATAQCALCYASRQCLDVRGTSAAPTVPDAGVHSPGDTEDMDMS
eukprot:scpid97985/ scgid16348/ 